MKRGNATIHVALSKAQINELLFAISCRPHAGPDLKQAQTILRRAVREPKATNDPQSEPERKTA